MSEKWYSYFHLQLTNNLKVAFSKKKKFFLVHQNSIFPKELKDDHGENISTWKKC